MSAIVGQTLKGQTKSITVAEDAVTISYRALYHGFVGDKRIPYSSMTAIQFKEPGAWLAGYIQFSIKGGVERRGQVNQDENALQFDASAAEGFRALRDFAQEQMGKNSGAVGAHSVADELTKLVALRDQGALTDEEFSALKSKVLGN